MRKFTEDTLVLATHNKGKIHEFEGLLAPYIGAFSSSLELGLLHLCRKRDHQGLISRQ